MISTETIDEIMDFEIIDTHCHLDFDAFDDDREEVIRRAAQKNISRIIIPATQKSNWQPIYDLCENDESLLPCYGFHPYWADEPGSKDIDSLEKWINSKLCVGIGECGLDYRMDQIDKQTQVKVFEAQLKIAANNNLPIVIHSVNATEDIINLIKKHPGITGKMHSYSGSYQQAQQLIDLGFYISFGGTITYKGASKHRATASKIPLSALIIESNAPDQPDSKHKNERNEPAYITNVLECLDELREENIDEITQQTTLNAKRLFGI